jgi:hypothetical protein
VSRRVCGKRCHDARGATCRCWCGGVFHGPSPKAEESRAEFLTRFGQNPKAESAPALAWAAGRLDLGNVLSGIPPRKRP